VNGLAVDLKKKQVIMKEYYFTTYNKLDEAVSTFVVEDLSAKRVRNYAKQVIANTRDNEVSHSRIRLKK